MSRRLALFFAAIAGLIAPSLRADSVATLPGMNSLGNNVSVFEINPLNSVSNFTSGDGAFVILPKPDGSKYYVIAKSPTNSVISVDNNFANPKTLASFNTSPTGAAITPDGTRLLVASDTLHIFDTTKDQELVAGGINPLVTVIDVAVSLDGTKAYTLGLSSAGGSQVNEVSLATNSVTGFPSYPFSGTATGISVGKNGRVYVSTQNQILELDPTTVQPTTGGIIGVNALPGKLVFTPDGKYGLAVNQTPITGQSILLVDLNAHAIINFVPNNNVVFDTLLVASSSTVFAYSTASQSLYQLGISSGGQIAIAGANTGGAPTTFVNGVAISNEVPFAGNATAHYLFVASAGTLYRVDLTVGPQVTAQTALPASQTINALDYVGLPSTGSPVVLLAYGDKQTIAPSKTSLPLVVQALDTNGKPASGVTVTFAASVNTASVSPTTATTGSNGFAQTILTAPSNNTTVTVVASAGKLQYGFTIVVGSQSTTGTGTLTISAGQGEVLASDTNTANSGSPMLVQLNDVNGNPEAGVQVIFTITPSALASGLGSLFPAAGFTGSITTTGVSVKTNAQGQAEANFLSGVVPNGLGSSQTAITAKAAGSNAVTFYETTYPSTANTAFTPTVGFLAPETGTVITGQAGTIIPGAFIATITDSFGTPLPNISVRACVPSEGNPTAIPAIPPSCTVPSTNAVPFGTCYDPTGQGVLSDAHGKVTCNLLLNGVVGSATIGAEYGYYRDTHAFTLVITPGPPGEVVIVQGNNQTGKPGQQLPLALRVQVQDSFGNVLPGVPVTWSVLNSGVPATLQNSSTGTDATGAASTLVTLGQTAGTVIIQLTAGNASTSFSLTVTNPAAGIQQVSGNNQGTLQGTAFPAPLVVEVVDGNGNPVSGAPVTFTLSSGSASIGTPSSSTGANGQTSTLVTAGSTAANIVIVATAGSFSTTFTLSAHQIGPTNVVLVNGATFQIQPGCTSLTGCVAPGEIVTVQGSGFADGVQGVVSGLSILGPLQTTLAGVSITFNGVAAPIFYVANVNGVESMTIQVPFETPVGNTTVVLNAAGGGSATITVPTQLYAPGVFTTTYGNQQIAVTVRSNGTYVSPTNPVQPGETIYVFATGLGQTNPAAATNTQGAGQLVTATVVTGLNNRGVPHTTVDYAPGLVGVYIIAVEVPQNVTAGPNQPFGLILTDANGNTYHCNTGYLPIQ